MAEAIAKSRYPGSAFSSRGVSACAGEGANPKSVGTASEHGLNLTKHKARQIGGRDFKKAAIAAMTRGHKELLLRKYAKYADRIYTLGELAGEPERDVPDPYGGTDDDYRDCFGMLEGLIAKIEGFITKK